MIAAIGRDIVSSMAFTADEQARTLHLQRLDALAMLRRDDGTIDWSPWYLSDEEDMGQSGQQSEIMRVLRSSLEVLAKQRAWGSVYIGTDNFFAWIESEPLVQVSPDIYLMDTLPPEGEVPARWQLWREGHRAPKLAVEIVSANDWKKDYQLNPPRYDHLGVSELVLIDPEAFHRRLEARGRVAFQGYRRNSDNALELVYRGRGPAYVATIDACVWCMEASPGRVRVRLSHDSEGRQMVPTEAELMDKMEARMKAMEERTKASLDSPMSRPEKE